MMNRETKRKMNEVVWNIAAIRWPRGAATEGKLFPATNARTDNQLGTRVGAMSARRWALLRQFVHYQSREPAQALRTRKIRPAWEAIAEFLTTCTNALAPESATLELYEATRFDTPYRVEPFLEKLAELFGPAERQQWGPDVSGDGRYEWALSGSQIEQARDFIAAQSWPKSIIGPVNLVVSHYFLWIDPTSRLPLPFQDPKYLVPLWKPQSHLLVWLGPRNRAFADWRFPFETIDADCRRYLDGVKSAAPISLSGKHFHLLIPNKGGTDYAVRKISPAAMDGL